MRNFTMSYVFTYVDYRQTLLSSRKVDEPGKNLTLSWTTTCRNEPQRAADAFLHGHTKPCREYYVLFRNFTLQCYRTTRRAATHIDACIRCINTHHEPKWASIILSGNQHIQPVPLYVHTFGGQQTHISFKNGTKNANPNIRQRPTRWDLNFQLGLLKNELELATRWNWCRRPCRRDRWKADQTNISQNWTKAFIQKIKGPVELLG